MAKYLFWMIKYSEALRNLLVKKCEAKDLGELNFEELIKILKESDISSKYVELIKFLDEISSSHLNEKLAMSMELNFNNYFNVAT